MAELRQQSRHVSCKWVLSLCLLGIGLYGHAGPSPAEHLGVTVYEQDLSDEGFSLEGGRLTLSVLGERCVLVLVFYAETGKATQHYWFQQQGLMEATYQEYRFAHGLISADAANEYQLRHSRHYAQTVPKAVLDDFNAYRQGVPPQVLMQHCGGE